MTTNEPHDTNWPDDLPLLTEVVEEDTLNDIATTSPAAPEVTSPAAQAGYSEPKLQQLLQELELHLGTVFADKLKLRLEHLQQQAVELAIAELKAELPELVRNALHSATEADTAQEQR